MREVVTGEGPAAAGFTFFPRDERQALRIRRFLLAAGTSLLVCATFFACAAFGYLPWGVAVGGTAGIVLLIVMFYAVFRSGLNLRFADPSLTTEQCGAAILWLAYIMYFAASAREALALFYPVVMLFGALHLNARRLMTLALLALGAHATMLVMVLQRTPSMHAAGALTEFVVLMVVLPWFAAMGGYVNGLRAKLGESNRELQGALERIERLAVRDELTGAYNRRYLLEVMRAEHERAGRFGTPYSVCLGDIDHFKSINDTLGHAAGDAVLRQLPQLAAESLRTVDVFGRYGGEEFLLILPGTPLDGARAAAERVRAAVAACAFPDIPAGRKVTMTLGVAEAARGEEPAALLARADAALYAGKARGRNRVIG